VKGAWAILVGLILALALWAPAAQAAATRAEYVAQAEPICKAANMTLKKQAAKAFKGIKAGPADIVPADNADHAARRRARRTLQRLLVTSGRLYVLLGRGINQVDQQLVTIPPPDADATAIGQWIESRRVIAEGWKSLGAVFKSGSLKKISKLDGQTFADLVDKETAADQIVTGYGFYQCLLERNGSFAK
jgi:hypothetical protein